MADIDADSPLRSIPQVAEVADSDLVEAELLGTPEVRVLLAYTRRILRLHDGYTLGVFSFSSTAQANWLFLIDGRDLSVARYDMPNNDIGTHGGALGADGNIYIMPYGSGRAYKFDVEAREFETIEVGLPKGEYSWAALGASNGCIYFGTYPNAYLGEYNIETGKCTLWKQVAPNTKYTTTFSEDSEGRIHFKATGPDQVWMVFDPQTGELEVSDPPALTHSSLPLPEPPEGDERFSGRVSAGQRRFVVSHPSGRFWEVSPEGELTLLAETQAFGEFSWWLNAVPGAIAGISYFGVAFRYDLETGEFVRKQLPNLAPAGNGLMFIEAVTPRWAIGANYSQQNLFKIDVQTGEIDHAPTVIARVTGEPMCAVGHKGKAYIGIYISSLIAVYDPEQPFGYMNNPRELIELGATYAQTRSRAAVTDGRFVYISSDSAYNHLGGALAVIDPETEHIDVYHHLIRDQNLPTLAYDPTTRLLWGGTDRWGQMRSHPPTQDSSLIYAFDPRTREVVGTLMPWPGSDVTSVLGVSANGILVAASGSEIALIATENQEVLYKGTSPIGVPSKTLLASDGFCYCLAGGKLYRWDLEHNVLTPVATSPGCYFLTEPLPGTWLLANSQSIYRVQLPSVGEGR